MARDIFDYPGDLMFCGASPGAWEAVDGSLVLDARPHLAASMATIDAEPDRSDLDEDLRRAMHMAAGLPVGEHPCVRDLSANERYLLGLPPKPRTTN